MRRSTILLALLITATLLGIVAARENTRGQFIALQEAQAKHFALDNRWVSSNWNRPPSPPMHGSGT